MPPRFLITAGNTRERIDLVRDWGNIFTGGTGFDIAKAMSELGPVELLTSNVQHIEQAPRLTGRHPVAATGFGTHAELKAALEAAMAGGPYDAVFMSAAVADYKPERTFAVLDRQPGSEAGQEVWIVRDAQAGKVKSDHDAIAVLGLKTPKLVDLFRTAWDHRGLLFKFKLEVGLSPEALVRVGQASRAASAADYLIANTLEMVRGPTPGAYLLSDAGAEWIDRPKLAARLREVAAGRLEL